MQSVKLLFVLADAEHARFVRPAEEDNTLHSSSRVLPEEGHAGAAAHPHNQHPEKFAAWVATELNQHQASFDELVLVSPSRVMTVIEQHLDQHVRAKIAGTLDKDLTKIATNDLWSHLKHWVRPVHRQKLL